MNEIEMIISEIDSALHELPVSKVIDRFVMNDILLDLRSKILSYEDVPAVIEEQPLEKA